MENNFSKWLDEVLKSRNMKPADLARAAKKDSGVISNIMNGKRNPSTSSCKAISIALDIPLDEVYRAAGILPPKTDIDPIAENVLHLLKDLDDYDKEEILDFVRLKHQRAKTKDK